MTPQQIAAAYGNSWDSPQIQGSSPNIQGGSYTQTLQSPNFVGPVLQPAAGARTFQPTASPSVLRQNAGFDAYKYADDPTVYRTSDEHGFTSWQEFLNAGGRQDMIRTIARPQNISLPGGNYSVNPATGGASISDMLAGLNLEPSNSFSLEDLRAGAMGGSASAITQFLADLRTERDKYRAALTQSMTPTQEENDIQTSLSELRKSADLLRINTQAGTQEMQKQPIAQKLIEGQQGALMSQSELSMQTMATQERALLERLGIAQSTRQAGAKAAELGLSFLEQDANTFFKVQETMAAEQERLFNYAATLGQQARETLAFLVDSFQGMDITELDKNTQQQLANIAARAGIPLGAIAAGMKAVKDQQIFDNMIKQSDLYAKLSGGSGNRDTSVIDINGRKVLIDNQTGQIIQDYSQTAGGGGDEKAAKIQNMMGLVNDLLTSGSLGAAVGPVSNILPTFRGATADFQAKFRQLQALLSVDNLSLLKGPMSDRDIEFVKQAASALNLGMSEAGFRAELEKIKQQLQRSYQNAAASGGGSSLQQLLFGGGGGGFTKPAGNAGGPNLTVSSFPLGQKLSIAFPPGSTGGQCGIFARNVIAKMGGTYPPLGDGLNSKIAAVQKYGTSLSNARVGSVIVTRENPTYGHVAVIIGTTPQGYVVAESNYKQSEKVSYGRIIPFNSAKIVGVINPTNRTA